MGYSGTPTQDFLSKKNKVVHISLNDSSSLKEALFKDLGREVVSQVASRMETLCQSGEEFAKFMCPVDTGELAESITHEVTVEGNKIHGVISAGTDHAMFVEFGTGIRGNGTYPGDASNWTYDYKDQNWKGQPANPFMFRTAEYLENNASKILEGK